MHMHMHMHAHACHAFGRYAPPKEWTGAQRRAVGNSLLVEYGNTVDAWSLEGNGGGLIFNIDAMVRATNSPNPTPTHQP